MTTRHAGYVVVLERDTREDDAEAIMSAIRMLKGVVSCEPVIAGPELHVAQERARELELKLWEVLKR